MTYPTEITLPFGDGHYRFWLPMPQVSELEKTTGMLALEWHLRESIGVTTDGTPVYAGGSTAEVRGIRETIRLALIGGNLGKVDGQETDVGPNRARELLEAYVYPVRPVSEAAALAWRILAAAIYGNDPGKHSHAVAGDPPAPSGDQDDAGE